MEKPLKKKMQGFACLDKDGEFIPDPSRPGWDLLPLDENEAQSLIGTCGTVELVPVRITVERLHGYKRPVGEF
jgi:hypothetical protein